MNLDKYDFEGLSVGYNFDNMVYNFYYELEKLG